MEGTISEGLYTAAILGKIATEYLLESEFMDWSQLPEHKELFKSHLVRINDALTNRAESHITVLNPLSPIERAAPEMYEALKESAALDKAMNDCPICGKLPSMQACPIHIQWAEKICKMRDAALRKAEGREV